MKTYSRKRHHDYRIIEDVQELCRLCLARVEETVPIFERVDNVCAALPMRIMICVGFEISHEECLPNTICTTCHQELQKYYKFRKKCEQSYLKLKSHLNAIKNKEKILESENNEEENKELFKEYQKLSADAQVDEMERLVIADVYNIEDQNELPIMALNSTGEQLDAVHEKDETTEIQVIEQSDEVSPDISTFLSAILVELGILVKNEQGLVVQDQGTSFELETGDDDQLMFELVEEGEVDSNEATMAFIIPEHTTEAKPQDMEFQPLATVEVNPLQMVQNKPEDLMEINSEQIVEDKTKEKRKTGRERKNNAGTKKNGAWCAVCGRTFASRGAVLRHGSVHSGARPHACPRAGCGRSFAQKVVLDRHLLVHEERRPYACSLCDKSYTQRGALAAHARSHAVAGGGGGGGQARALQLHACTLCDRMFLYASGLSRHMMTHSGRMFACGACDRLFNDKSSLSRHLRNAHRTRTDRTD